MARRGHRRSPRTAKAAAGQGAANCRTRRPDRRCARGNSRHFALTRRVRNSEQARGDARAGRDDDEESVDQRRGVDPRSSTGQLVAALQQRREMRLIRGRLEIGPIDFGFDGAKVGLAGGDRALTSPTGSASQAGSSGEKGEKPQDDLPCVMTQKGRGIACFAPSFSFLAYPRTATPPLGPG
jgi:hypothetical protein